MNCHEFDDIVLDAVRKGGDVDVERHAASCGRCAGRLAAERELATALAALRRAAEGASAPESLEAPLLAAFRAARRPRWRLAWAAAAAVLLALGLGLALRLGRAPETAAAAAEVATPFIPLPYGAPLADLEGATLVRVTVPRSTLVAVGLPVNGELLDEPVEADLVVGEDGIPRAIRFVQ